jgi:hypothetical protein
MQECHAPNVGFRLTASKPITKSFWKISFITGPLQLLHKEKGQHARWTIHLQCRHSHPKNK